MSSVTTAERMTADEFLALGLREDGRGGQLVDGEVVMNEPTWTHNQAQIAIVFALRAWSDAEEARGATGLPLDVKFEELDAATTLASPLLPGFALPVAEIFGD